jgi:signal peptidase I
MQTAIVRSDLTPRLSHVGARTQADHAAGIPSRDRGLHLVMTNDSPTRRGSLRNEIGFFVALFTVLFVTRASFADQYVVPSESMMPTVHVGDRVLVEKVAYGLRIPLTHCYVARFANPQRGDVVVLDAPDQDTVLLKRVVAVEGDHVRLRGGRLVVNGNDVPVLRTQDALVEQLGGHAHSISLDEGGGPDFDGVVPHGQVLLVGDNRGNSRDGRYFGYVSRDRILGRAQGTFLRDGRPGRWSY